MSYGLTTELRISNYELRFARRVILRCEMVDGLFGTLWVKGFGVSDLTNYAFYLITDIYHNSSFIIHNY